MGQHNKARRAAKARQRAKQRTHRANGAQGASRQHHDTSDPIFDDAARAELAWLTAAQVGVGRRLSDRETGLDQLARLPRRAVVPVAERLIESHIAALWEHGWQPRELHRQARVGARGGAVAMLVELAVAVDCMRRLASAVDLHPQWREQAEAIADLEVGPAAGWLDRATPEPAATANPGAAYAAISTAMKVLCELPPIDVLIPPPGHRIVRDSPRPKGADPLLERIRNLLAKAESTEFEAEAIALTAKAQELITRHAIDTALLSREADAPDREPIMIRVAIDAPYADAKSLLLQTVAAASRCSAVFVMRVSHSNVVGFPDDLRAVEILFTSLLVQAQHALTEAGRAAPPGAQPRSQSFRSAFLLAYTQRIGERLEEINEHVFSAAQGTSASFLPVLRSQEDAIASFMTERFGDAFSNQVRGGWSPSGWSSGRLAADRARLAAGDLEGADEGLF